MSIPKLKVYRLEKNYNQANDTDVQSLGADELYPVSQKPLDPSLSKLLVGVEHRDTAVVLKDYSDGNPIPQYAMIGMKPIYGDDGEIESYSLTITDEIGCDGWRLDKNSIKLYIKKIPLASPDTTIGDEMPTDLGLWTEYTTKENYKFLFDSKTIAYDSSFEEIDDAEENYALIVGRREKKTLSIEFGALLFLDSAFWQLEGLTQYNQFKPIDNIVVEYQMYKEVLNGTLVADYATDSIVPFGALYNGNKEGYSNKKDYPSILTINEGNTSFKRSIYPLRQLVAQTAAKALLVAENDFYQDVEIESSGTIEVFNTGNWIQSGDLAPVLVERITVFDDDGVSREIYKELTLNKQYNRSPVITYIDEVNNIRGKYIFNLISDYYRTSDGSGLTSIRFPDELFIRYNEVDDNLGNVFDFDYKYNNIADEVLIENNTAGEYENKGICIYSDTPDGYIYKKKNILAIQSTSSTLTDDDLTITIDAGLTFQTATIPATFYYDADRPLEIYDNGIKVWDSVDGDVGATYDITLVGDELTITLNTATVLPEDVMIIYYERHAIGIGKDSDMNYWCMGLRVSCYEKVDLTDTFVSSHNNWVSNHLNNNPDVFKGYSVYEGTGTEGAPSSGLTFTYLESGYNIYYREGYVVLSEKVVRILSRNEAKNFASFDPEDVSADGYKTYTTGVRANYAYYIGLVNLSGAVVRNYTARGGQYVYKLFDSEIYPLSCDKRMVLRNDSYMPSFFECGGKNLPDINTFSGIELIKFTATSVTYGQGIRVNTVDNRLSSVLFNVNTTDQKSWIKIFINHNYSESNTIINDENAQLIDGDIPIYCLYYDDVSIGVPYTSGFLYIGSDDVTDSGFVISGSDLVKMEEMADIFPVGTSLLNTDGTDVVETIPQYVYSNQNWTYDVVFELLSYRGASSIEILVYRKERE